METERAVCQLGICLTTMNVRERLISFFCSFSIWWGEFSIYLPIAVAKLNRNMFLKSSLPIMLKLKNTKWNQSSSCTLLSICNQPINNLSSIQLLPFLKKYRKKSGHKFTSKFVFLCKAIYRALMLKVYKYINDMEKRKEMVHTEL